MCLLLRPGVRLGCRTWLHGDLHGELAPAGHRCCASLSVPPQARLWASASKLQIVVRDLPFAPHSPLDAFGKELQDPEEARPVPRPYGLGFHRQQRGRKGRIWRPAFLGIRLRDSRPTPTFMKTTVPWGGSSAALASALRGTWRASACRMPELLRRHRCPRTDSNALFLKGHDSR